MKRHTLGAALLALVAAACQEAAQAPVNVDANALPDSAEQVMVDVATTLFFGGAPRIDLTADTSYTYENATRFEFFTVHVVLRNEKGLRSGTVDARKGTYRTREQQLEGRGNVVVVSDSTGARLTTQYLRYDQGSDRVSTDSAYVLTRGRDINRGVGFDADSKLTNVTCHAACSNY